jgi:multiple sugar transport system substrate-binding protein
MYNAKLWNEDITACTMNTPEGIKAVQSILNGRSVDKYAMTAEDMSVQGDWDTFMAGKLAMFPTGPWAVGAFNQNITTFTWDIAHMPAGDRQATHLYANSYAMSAASKNKDAAWKFIKFATGPEGTKLRQDGKYEISPVREVAEKYYLASLAGSSPEHASVFLEAMDYAVPQPVHANWNQIFDAIQPEIDLALAQSESVEDALKNACDGMNAVLNP